MRTFGNDRSMSTQTMVLGAILTALVVVFQLMGSFIRFGPVSISLVLIPIVIGAAMCGKGIAAWLGLVFAVVVLAQPDTMVFWTISPIGTVLTVVLKGVACGFCAGIIYDILKKFNRYVAVMAAAVVCPIVNSGIFFLGCLAFFFEDIKSWGLAVGFESGLEYVIIGMIGINFLVELLSNMLLSPVIVRVLNISLGKK